MAIRNSVNLIILLGLIFSLLSCESQPPYVPLPDWSYADLRALDPAEDIPPSQDLVAMYIRRLSKDVEIRLDLLDISTPTDCDLSLIINTALYGNDTITIHIPATGEISALDTYGHPIQDLHPRITRDTFLDIIVISLDRSNLTRSGLPFLIQVVTTSPSSSIPVDILGPVRSDTHPPQRGNILFAFWDTFSAATPSQALRAWDGAHSGPGRSRHGLQNLLNAVRAYDVPVFLLDLKTLTTLSALDYLGVLQEIKNLTSPNLVILPDVSLYEIPANASTSFPRKSAIDLSESPFLYTILPLEQLTGDYPVAFIPSDRLGVPALPTQPYRWQDHIIIPVPEENSTITNLVPTPTGPSLALRHALIQFALNPQGSLFVLGGEFSSTSWGDPSCVSPTIRYLVAHPWLQFLNADSLLTMHTSLTTQPAQASNPQYNQRIEAVYLALTNSPASPITDTAWQMFYALQAPASSELAALRDGYMGIIGHMLVAARWDAGPGSISDCSIDFDWDGQAECILASPDFLATLEISGAYAVSAFVRRADGVHQVIAPYAQFVVGLGDPSTWDPSRGTEGDPALIPGGFVDEVGPWIPLVKSEEITFTTEDNKSSKTFRLTGTGLHVEYWSESPIAVQISIGLDPWTRFTQGWEHTYQEVNIPGGWEWGIDSGTDIKITTSGALSAKTFTDSLSYMSSPEDPNFDYPPGHYVPFPLALVGILGEENFYINLDIR
jgi:hypothetical protein